jgi:hypothetical protein
MPNQIQPGTMMVQQSVILQSLGVESEPYCRNWHSLGIIESSGLDHKIRAAGWNLFFMAGELRAVVPACSQRSKSHRPSQRSKRSRPSQRSKRSRPSQ